MRLTRISLVVVALMLSDLSELTAESLPEAVKRLGEQVEILRGRVDQLSGAKDGAKGPEKARSREISVIAVKTRNAVGLCQYSVEQVAINEVRIKEFGTIRRFNLDREGPAAVDVQAVLVCSPARPTSAAATVPRSDVQPGDVYGCNGGDVVDLVDNARILIDVDPEKDARECRTIVKVISGAKITP